MASLPSAQPTYSPESSDLHSEPLPRRFGKYTLLRKIATGGMAELFLAIQKSVAGFEKLIVIKRILPSMNHDKAFIEMLLHEARIAATLSHANIVQIFDVGQVEGTYYIAMEHVHGEDLRSIVRQMRKKAVSEFPLEHTVAIMLAVCGGLAYAHEKRDLDGSSLNIVHRDISPQNIVVTFSGDVKIVDFGIAKSDTKMQMETRSGKLKGKVPYMSPEQARGEPIDSRSDIFAVGVMLFELTTGKRLFKGQSEFETLKLICEREYPLPSQIRPGYPPELESIVMRALMKERSERYQNARDMQGALETFVRREQIPVSNIALTEFMQNLFEEKLASQKQDLLAGKQLADIIELQQAAESQTLEDPSNPRLSQSVLSAPAAARTITDVSAAAAHKRGGAGVALTSLALAVAIGAGGFYYWQHKQKAALAAQEKQATTAAAASLPVNRGSISVTTNPPGATIWIDGEMRSEVTPSTISLLPTGRPIDVKLTKEGFELAKQIVTLADSQPTSSPTVIDVALSKGSVVVDLNVTPPGLPLSYLLDGKAAKPGADPHTLEGISSGDMHKLVVSAPGYVDQTLQFIGAPQEKKKLDVSMQKEPRHARGGGGGGGPAPAAVTGSGKMNIGAAGGWCNVSVDGVAKGATPVAGLELSAGPHHVTCTPPDHAPMSATVVVPAEGTARYRFTLGS
jgi:eukaryotic-like serine/threonine-protein kinase